MPIYDFECQACGAAFEELVRSSEASSQVPCPKCGAERARRLVSAFAAAPGGKASASRPSRSGPRAGGGCGSGCGCRP